VNLRIFLIAPHAINEIAEKLRDEVTMGEATKANSETTSSVLDSSETVLKPTSNWSIETNTTIGWGDAETTSNVTRRTANQEETIQPEEVAKQKKKQLQPEEVRK